MSISKRLMPHHHTPDTRTVAGAFLALLKARGVDWLFTIAGTDFVPLAAAVARSRRIGFAIPRIVPVPHESVAIGMAHGYYLATGRPAAVMGHTNVGTANCLMGLINASRENVPIVYLAGHTPVSETGRLGSRDMPIHWGQDMPDQPGLVRPFVKWDDVLDGADRLESMVDRGLSIAMSEPRGPIYIGLPREALAAPVEGFTYAVPPRVSPSRGPGPDADAIDEAAKRIAAAESPLIVATRTGREPGAEAALVKLVERFAIPVVEHWPSTNSLASSHPMHAGFNPAPRVAEADVVIVLDTLVPWIPSRGGPSEDCVVIHIGSDPLFPDVRTRGMPAAITIASRVAPALDALAAALETIGSDPGAIDDRRSGVAALRQTDADRIAEALRATADAQPINAHWATDCLNRAMPKGTIVFNELGSNPALLDLPHAGCYQGFPVTGGLGWGLPAAMGYLLAKPDQTVVATIGDGSHMFANPVACHQTAAALDLPLLTVVFNNGHWNSVRLAAGGMYPDADSIGSDADDLFALTPSPRFERVIEASGGLGLRVERADELPGIFERAFSAVCDEKRQALVNVICQGSAYAGLETLE